MLAKARLESAMSRLKKDTLRHWGILMARYSGIAWAILISLGLSFVEMGCAGPGRPKSSPCPSSPASPSSSPLPDVRVKHVFIVVEENHSYSRVIGNPNMPYLNSLATTYALAKGYFANTHPSIGNYFMLTTGQIITNDDAFSDDVTDDNIVRHLIDAGKTWKEYSENLPFVGYAGGDTAGYTEHHNPLSYFSDVRESSTQMNNLVPFTQFSTDLASRALPNYSFIVPSNEGNAARCPAAIPDCTDDQKLAAADSWLATNIDPLIRSSDFNTPGGGLLIITFDESAKSDTTHGGGNVAWVIVSPDVKKGYTSTACYQHESTLRFMSEAIGLTDFPGAAATAPDMEEFILGD